MGLVCKILLLWCAPTSACTHWGSQTFKAKCDILLCRITAVARIHKTFEDNRLHPGIPGSARVEISPNSPTSVTPLEIFLKIRRIILPERVLGSPMHIEQKLRLCTVGLMRQKCRIARTCQSGCRRASDSDNSGSKCMRFMQKYSCVCVCTWACSCCDFPKVVKARQTRGMIDIINAARRCCHAMSPRMEHFALKCNKTNYPACLPAYYIGCSEQLTCKYDRTTKSRNTDGQPYKGAGIPGAQWILSGAANAPISSRTFCEACVNVRLTQQTDSKHVYFFICICVEFRQVITRLQMETFCKGMTHLHVSSS